MLHKLTYAGGLAATALCIWLLTHWPAEGQEKQDPATVKALQELRTKVRKTNLKLMINGQYSCCISPGCAFCTLALGNCPCVKRLSDGNGVCHTCKGGWEAGHGSVPGVKKEKVKAFEGAYLKKVFDTRKKALKKRRK